jgi:hypothetical protein
MNYKTNYKTFIKFGKLDIIRQPEHSNEIIEKYCFSLGNLWSKAKSNRLRANLKKFANENLI